MKILIILVTVLYSLMGVSMDESNQNRIKREINTQGFAAFEDTKTSPFDEKELALMLEFFDANCESEDDYKSSVHRTSYIANFFRRYTVKDSKLSKKFKAASYNAPPEKKLEDLNFIFTRILDLFTVPKDAKRLLISIRILSDCESIMRAGIEAMKEGQIKEFVVDRPEIPYHQDRFDDDGLSFNWLFFQILSTQGFDEHYSLIAKAIKDGKLSKHDAVTYENDSVELLAKIQCKNGSGFAVNQDAEPVTVHGRSPLSAVFGPNCPMPHRKLMIVNVKILKAQDLLVKAK